MPHQALSFFSSDCLRSFLLWKGGENSGTQKKEGRGVPCMADSQELYTWDFWGETNTNTNIEYINFQLTLEIILPRRNFMGFDYSKSVLKDILFQGQHCIFWAPATLQTYDSGVLVDIRPTFLGNDALLFANSIDHIEAPILQEQSRNILHQQSRKTLRACLLLWWLSP